MRRTGGAVLIDTASAHGPPPKPVDLPGVQAVPESAVVVPVDGPAAAGAALAPGEPDALAADEDLAAAGAAAGPADGPAEPASSTAPPTQPAQTPTVFVPLATVTASVLAAASAHTLPIKALRFPRTQDDRLRLDIFRDLWRRGHYMTVGVKFGGDYLVYAGDPSRYHSHFVAFVQSPRQVRARAKFEGRKGWVRLTGAGAGRWAGRRSHRCSLCRWAAWRPRSRRRSCCAARQPLARSRTCPSSGPASYRQNKSCTEPVAKKHTIDSG